MSQCSHLPAHLHNQFQGSLERAVAYPVDCPSIPLSSSENRGGPPPLQHVPAGLHAWESLINLPSITSASSSELGNASLQTQHSARGNFILQEAPSQQLGMNPGAGSQEGLSDAAPVGSMPLSEEGLLQTLQQMSITVSDHPEAPGWGRGVPQLPQMPATVWQGIPSSFPQSHPPTWEDAEPQSSWLNIPTSGSLT